jgi:hypothetical protein
MRRKKRVCSTVEWIQGKTDNIGVIVPVPIQILEEWISQKGLSNILREFWKIHINKIYLLDICTLLNYWWEDKSILAARYNFLNHPKHNFAEYVFDKSDLRTIIVFRQPDIDGKHWKENHVHIVRGNIDAKDNCNISRPNFDEHVALFGPPISGLYVIKVF